MSLDRSQDQKQDHGRRSKRKKVDLSDQRCDQLQQRTKIDLGMGLE
jgi:hypothetical protein